MDDRAKLLDLVGGKLPAVIAEWDDGDNHMRAVLDGYGSDAERIIDEATGGTALYLFLEEHHADKLGRDSWRRWDSYGDDRITRGLVLEMLMGRINREVRHGG